MTPKTMPEELRACPQWVCHNNAKVPVCPQTGKAINPHDPANHLTFDVACVAANAAGLGLGFVFTESDDFTGIDLDVPEGGVPSAFQSEIFNAFQSYAERSISGRGLHIICKGKVPAAVKNSAEGVEVYSSGRYFAMTGDAVRNERVLDMQSNLNALYARLRPQEATVSHSQEAPDDVSLVGDEDAVAFVRKSEANRRNWDGEGVKDQSKAFGAVVGALALAGCSREQAKRLALSSPLVVNGPPHSSGTRPEKSARDFDRVWPALARRGAAERQARAVGVEHGRQVLVGMTVNGKPLTPPVGKAERFRVLHVSDLGDREPSYVIDGLIEARTYGVVFGAPGSAKTFLAIDMAACVATGNDYHGKAVHHNHQRSLLQRQRKVWRSIYPPNVLEVTTYFSVRAYQPTFQPMLMALHVRNVARNPGSEK